MQPSLSAVWFNDCLVFPHTVTPLSSNLDRIRKGGASALAATLTRKLWGWWQFQTKCNYYAEVCSVVVCAVTKGNRKLFSHLLSIEHPGLQLPISGKIIPKWFFNVICSQTYVPLKWAQDWNIWTTSKRKNSVFSRTRLSFLYTYESDISHFLTLFST